MSMKFEMPSEREEKVHPEITKEGLVLSEDEISQIIMSTPEYQEASDDKKEADEIYRKRREQAEIIIKQLEKAVEEDIQNVAIGFRNTELEFSKSESALIEARNEAKALATFKKKALEVCKEYGKQFLEDDFEKIYSSSDEDLRSRGDLAKKRRHQVEEIIEQGKKNGGEGFEESINELEKVAKEADSSLKLRDVLAKAFEKKYYDEYWKTRDFWKDAENEGHS